MSIRRHSGSGAVALVLVAGALLMILGRGCTGTTGSGPSDSGVGESTGQPDVGPPLCPDGVDNDKDGYGINCALGPDCNDQDPTVNPGAKEICDGKDNNCNNQTDEGVLNACGTCDPGCNKLGANPFPLDPASDVGVKDATGVGLDANGDLILDKTKVNFNYMWIANTNDQGRGTVSKIDTVKVKEVARYFTVTCHSQPGLAGCVDLHGKPITNVFAHAPSRTAVDFNFDVWVANRAFGGQASASKIANDVADCVDRNKSGTIETSRDLNGDGQITVDCDGDGQPDNAATVCTGAFAGKPPEFVGDDDECILYTVNYGEIDDLGRSICLDTGTNLAASNAWVGTYQHPGQNRYYKIDGSSGALNGPYDLNPGHSVYGCVVDSQRILWSSDYAGSLTYLNTVNPTQVGPVMQQPWDPKGAYGITIDGKDQIWTGGWGSGRVYRYRPDRTSFANLASGVWTGIAYPTLFDYSRGIAADNRGKVWVAINNGYIWRVDQNLPDGLQDQTASTSYWPTKGSGITGVGVDFAGNLWGISNADSFASRLDVDAKGDPVLPATTATKFVPVGTNPYTYSDFTGFGLQNFTRPQGRYLYQLEPCANFKPRWKQVSWTADVPSGSALSVRVRSGDTETTMGAWDGPFQSSPALLDKSSATPLDPNPAAILQVEFILQSIDKTTSPVLKDFNISYDCAEIPK